MTTTPKFQDFYAGIMNAEVQICAGNDKGTEMNRKIVAENPLLFQRTPSEF